MLKTILITSRAYALLMILITFVLKIQNKCLKTISFLIRIIFKYILEDLLTMLIIDSLKLAKKIYQLNNFN